jgi:hypothetical protein
MDTTTREARIICTSGATTCHGFHATARQVFRCYVAAGRIADVWTCGWQYEGAIATGDPAEPCYRGILECDAPAKMRADGSGFDCSDGHEHTFAEWLAEHGQAYAEDDEEAARLLKAGVQPLHITDGTAYL